MKFVISALTDVAEALRGEYEQRGDKFYLKTEGDFAPLIEANTKLTEFRDNNRTLNTTVTDLNSKLKVFEGIDPAEHAKLKTKIADLEKGGIKDKSDVAALVEAAVKAAVAPLEANLKTREESEKAAQTALARKSLETDLREAGVKAGINEKAVRDYINRGLEVFKLVDGVAAARKGDAPIFSKTRPAEVLTMEEWATELRSDAPHLFTPSSGGGAGGSGGAGGNSGVVVKKTISSDPLEFGKNLEGIAKGEVLVQQ